MDQQAGVSRARAELRQLLSVVSEKNENNSAQEATGNRAPVAAAVSIMGMLNPPYGLWSIWKELPDLQRGVVILLGIVGAYCLFSAVNTMLQLRAMRKPAGGSASVNQRSVASLSSRCSNMRQLINATFYLFGVVLFLRFQNVAFVLGDGKAPLWSLTLGNFILDSAFAANVFFIVLVLHLIQWFVSSRVNSFAKCVDRLP